MLVLSLSLANTIAEPVRRLADAAERVRRGIRSRQQIPDFTARSDEIGHLSRALRDMTQALYNRLDAIESFAADVAHELKNPLTSLRSALETLPRVNIGHSRDRLIAVMQHDVRRLDRLISDISDASRLDAELARGEANPVDVGRPSARCRVDGAGFPAQPAPPESNCPSRSGAAKTQAPTISFFGHDSRLAQVVTNLIDNACSFSEPGGVVRVALERTSARSEPEGEKRFDRVVITVDDDGPGIPPHALERIFERFYTDRPSQGFGQNSGLGLSISRQIVEAHGGRIWACNRPAELASVPAASAECDNSEETIAARRGRALRRRIACVLGMTGALAGEISLHATAVIYGESGVLILGPSGSGKSALALALMARARRRRRILAP